MGIILYLCVIGVLLHQAQSYVLLQVSKDEQNRSNVDALIHKIVPSDQYDRIAQKIASNRKQFPPYPTRIDHPDSIYSKTDDREERQERQERAREDIEETKENNNENLLQNILTGLLKPMWKPILRTSVSQIEPEVVNFRSSNSKPSLLYEVSADTFVEAIKDILQSRTIHQYVEEIAKRAAAVYRTIKHYKKYISVSNGAYKL